MQCGEGRKARPVEIGPAWKLPRLEIGPAAMLPGKAPQTALVMSLRYGCCCGTAGPNAPEGGYSNRPESS